MVCEVHEEDEVAAMMAGRVHPSFRGKDIASRLWIATRDKVLQEHPTVKAQITVSAPELLAKIFPKISTLYQVVSVSFLSGSFT